MKQIIIKKKYYDETKELLKQIRSYSSYVKTYYIIFSGNKTILKFIYCNETKKYNIKYDEITSEVIHALIEANKDIIYKIK